MDNVVLNHLQSLKNLQQKVFILYLHHKQQDLVIHLHLTCVLGLHRGYFNSCQEVDKANEEEERCRKCGWILMQSIQQV